MRSCGFVLFVAVAAFGCGSGATRPRDAGLDAAPIHVKQPPSKSGSETTPACAGVTNRGRCEGETAVTCDLATGGRRSVDCSAQGERCVVYADRGARCVESGNGGVGAFCATGLGQTGLCDGETARWCDQDGTMVWDCAQAGLECLIDACAPGAFCCHPATPTTDAGVDPCQGLDERGVCGGPTGQLARYCADGQLFELDCVAMGKTCQIDTCATGAFCCPEQPQADQCLALGSAGECAAGVLRYCTLDATIRELPCGDYGLVCAVDSCSVGEADCCEPRCEDVGLSGVCLGQDLVYCAAGALVTVNCGARGQRCEPRGGCVSDAAACCPAP